MSDRSFSQSPIVRNDRVYRETKWLAVFIIPFLVAAFYILYLRPTETGELFAWKIDSPMTAMMLGSVYIGGAYYFVRVVGASQWHSIQIGFLPVTIFASYLGIATILHWDRFTQGHISFYAWAALYLVSPFLVVATWMRNRPVDPGISAAESAIMPQGVRIVMAVIGVIAFVVVTILFLFPQLMLSVWPWPLTPLTARVVGAMFALGLTAAGIGLEQRWSGNRLMVQALIFMMVMVLSATARGWGEFDQAKPSTWMFVGGLIFIILVSAGFYFYMERQPKRTSV